MDAFATVEDYEKRYGAVSDTEILEECLQDASRVIAAALDTVGIDYTSPSDDYAERLMQVCRSVTSRAMSAVSSTMPFGATQYSQGAGGYSESYSLGNPYGEVYLTKSEKKLLGIGKQYLGFIFPCKKECVC